MDDDAILKAQIAEEIKRTFGVKDLKTYVKWLDTRRGIKIRKQDMNKIVMDFLLTEGYDEAAEKFHLETGIQTGIDIGNVADRLAVKTALQNGDVQAAIEKLNVILDTSPHLFFRLQQHQMIELIRNGKTEEALKYAREDLAPTVEKNQSFLEDMEKTVALLGFKDPSNCPYGELLDISLRLKFANKVNAVILTNQRFEQDSQLLYLLKMLRWVNIQLAEVTDYPLMRDFMGSYGRKTAS